MFSDQWHFEPFHSHRTKNLPQVTPGMATEFKADKSALLFALDHGDKAAHPCTLPFAIPLPLLFCSFVSLDLSGSSSSLGAPGAVCQNPTGCARVLFALVQGLWSVHSPFTLKRDRGYTYTVSSMCQLHRTFSTQLPQFLPGLLGNKWEPVISGMKWSCNT